MGNSNIKDIIDYSWLSIGDISQYKTDDFLLKPSELDQDNYGITPLRLMKNPEYMGYTCKALLNLELLPEQCVILSELWERKFPMFVGSRGWGKTWLLAVYSMLKMALTPQTSSGDAGVKIVITGAAFRQSQFVFDYMQVIWDNAPRLRSICRTSGRNGSGGYRDPDKRTMRVGPNWAVAIPLGSGDTIRGYRANIVIADEFSSIPIHIFETVVQGFTSVSSSPIEAVKLRAKRKVKQSMGMWSDDEEEAFNEIGGNQIIISGTASYEFEHYADYWKRYKDIIESRGDEDTLRRIFKGDIPPGISWKDFSVIRMPYELIPEGFLDDNIMARAKATTHSGTFAREYGAVFTKDSNGFFKRSLIESCVASNENVMQPDWPKWCPDPFDALTRGNPHKKYVFGVDAASEVDNFSIVVIEVHQEHSRVVYSWTTTRKRHKEQMKAGLTDEDDFYAFGARKIRDLMRLFPCERVMLDAQGGGIAVLEALQDKDKLKEGEIKIWPVIDEDKPADTDDQAGLHIVELVQFARYEWVSQANHGMRKDLEDRVLLFPRFDPVTLEIAIAEDKARELEFSKNHPNKKLRIYDTLEDCVLEIEELKDELTSIILTRTGTGTQSRDRWSTPETKVDGKKGYMTKDRYCSLLMANMGAREVRLELAPFEMEAFGGLIVDSTYNEKDDIYTHAPDWFKEGMNDVLKGV